MQNVPIPLRWGLEHKEIAHETYSVEIQKSDPHVIVVKSGLWIDTNRGWLATSPDGLVLTASGKLNCPFSAKDMSPLKAANQLSCFLCNAVNGNIPLKKDPNHFYQVQGKLAITKASWCDYCVYTPHGFCTEWISSLWQQTVQALDTFFSKFMTPHLSHV